ncbi:MAG: hypothetical protein LBB91_04660 [Clostridiales bacterium]|nr:hypothetical protein [Clostridiales bacterium]
MRAYFARIRAANHAPSDPLAPMTFGHQFQWHPAKGRISSGQSPHIIRAKPGAPKTRTA